MNRLDKLALCNLLFLQDKETFTSNSYKLVGNRFSKIEDNEKASDDESNESNEFDAIYSYKELDYPLYFTFHQIMNHITYKYTYANEFYGYTKRDLIKMMEGTIDILYDHYSKEDEADVPFEELLEDLEDKVVGLKGIYYSGICHYLPTLMNDYLSIFCKTLLGVSREICKDYILELKDPGSYESDESDDDKSDDDKSADDKSDEADDDKSADDESDEADDDKSDESDINKSDDELDDENDYEAVSIEEADKSKND